MAALARLAQVEHRAPCDHLAAVREKRLEHLPKIEQARLTINQGHHVDAEGVLELRLLVEVVEHHLGHFAALELDHHPHARLVGLVTDVGDALEFAFVHQFGNALKQQPLVDLIGQLVNDDRTAVATIELFKVGAGANHHPATAGAIALPHTRDAVDGGAGGKIGSRHQLNQLIDARLGAPQQKQTGVDDFTQVMRRNVGGHAHGNARRAIDQQVGNPCWQNRGLEFLAVVIRLKIHGFTVDVGEHFAGELVEPALGVTHGGGVVAVNRPEVALPVHQWVTQRKILRHANQRVVDGAVAVRVKLTHHLTHHPRALHIGPIPDVVGLVHGIKHAPVHGLQPVPHIR